MTNRIKIEDDRLVTEWKIDGRFERRGKRISKLRAITREEQREYVKHGTVAAVKMIRQRLGLENGSLARALTLLNTERAYNREFYLKHFAKVSNIHFDESLVK